MVTYVLRRLLQSGISILAIVVIVFFLARLTGNPADLYLPVDALEQARVEFAERYGFNDPVIVQFGRFLQNLARGDLGDSIRLGIPALDAVAQALPTTLMLAGIVIPLALLISIVIGSRAALKPGGFFDRIASGLALASASVPSFWLGIVAILIFAVQLRWLPSSGTGTVSHWIMPVGVLVVAPVGILVQIVRGSMITALASPYVKTALAKGLGRTRILFVHCVRNAMIPVITVASDLSIGILNGAVIVEVIFGISGVGRLLLDSVIYRDYALLQAIVIITAVMVFIVTALTDVIYALLDPRIRNV